MIHIANSAVEEEYALGSQGSLRDSFTKHKLCLQLQFLPLLYCRPSDLVAVTAIPEETYLARICEYLGFHPRLVLLNNFTPFQGKECRPWGHSLRVQKWAQERQAVYRMPEWEVVQLINSKAFSFNCHALPQAALIQNQKDLHRWLGSFEGIKVLKTCYGFSGQGHTFIDSFEIAPKILQFCENEWRANRPIIGEPWLERVMDFSTQWLIQSNKEIQFLGATRFEANTKGVYHATLAGPQELLFGSFLPFLEEHLAFVRKPLKEIAGLGFFGHLGIDAFVFKNQGKNALNPLVEINGRQTMSWVALNIQKNRYPQHVMRMAYKKEGRPSSLLPEGLALENGASIHFPRTLTIS